VSCSDHCILCSKIDLIELCRAPSPLGERLYLHCQHCDLVYLDPNQRLSLRDERAQYDLHSNQIDDLGYRKFLNRLVLPLAKHLPTPPKRVLQGLDFGCGPEPALAKLLGESGHEIQSYDPTYFPCIDLLNFQYDFITCSEVIEHMYDPLREFRGIHHMLKPGAILAIMTGMCTSWQDFASWHYRRELTHVCFYGRKSMGWIGRHFNWQLRYLQGSVAIFANKGN
jgi:SAM-dependent methyltransferase